MAKTKPFSFRIDNNLYANVSRLAESFKVSFATVIEKALVYFKFNPDQILEFPIEDPKLLEYIELSKKPNQTLISLRQQGVATLGQLYWIISLIQCAWQRAEDNVTSEWLGRLVNVFDILLQEQIVNREDIIYYLQSTYPESGENLDERITKTQIFLQKRSKVSSTYADSIVRCLSFLIKKSDLSISDERFAEINKLITPWCFWVAQRALSGEQKLLNIDATPLLHFKSTAKKEFTLQESKDVYVEVLLSSEGIGPFNVGKREFACGFTISKDGQLLTNFSCTAEQFYDLLAAISLIKDNKMLTTKGCWEIMKNEEHNVFTLRKNGVLIPLSRKTLEDFMNLVVKLYKREDVQNDILNGYVEIYGAL